MTTLLDSTMSQNQYAMAIGDLHQKAWAMLDAAAPNSLRGYRLRG